MEKTPLLRAAETGDRAALTKLLAGAGPPEVDARGPGGLTALMRAAARGHPEIVDLLLGAGAAVDACDDFGNSALMYACARGQAAVAARLVAAGAAKDRTNRFGLGPADWAKWPANGEALADLVGG